MALQPSNPGPAGTNGREPMQRVRVGVTGLAFILLLVALATAVITGVRRTVSAGAAGGVAQAPTGKAPADNSEPLEKLGVTPPVDSPAHNAAAPDPARPVPAPAPQRQ